LSLRRNATATAQQPLPNSVNDAGSGPAAGDCCVPGNWPDAAFAIIKLKTVTVIFF